MTLTLMDLYQNLVQQQLYQFYSTMMLFLGKISSSISLFNTALSFVLIISSMGKFLIFQVQNCSNSNVGYPNPLNKDGSLNQGNTILSLTSSLFTYYMGQISTY